MMTSDAFPFLSLESAEATAGRDVLILTAFPHRMSRLPVDPAVPGAG